MADTDSKNESEENKKPTTSAPVAVRGKRETDVLLSGDADNTLTHIASSAADGGGEPGGSTEAAPGDAAASGSANAAAELDCVSTVSNYHDARDDDDRRSVRSGRINDSKSGRKKEFPTPALQLFYRLDELLGRGEVAAKAAVLLATDSRVTKEELQGEKWTR